MIVERIGDNQIKFTLTEVDLRERNIKLTELAYGTEKTQALFREMMERASNECGFESDNTPLFIEAVPLAIDSIVIIVTKISGMGDIEEKFSMLPRPKDSAKYRPLGLLEVPTDKNKGKEADNNTMIFSFPGIDEASNAALRLAGVFCGESDLIKAEKKYFLVLENNQQTKKLSNDELDSILSEFGQRHISNVIAKHYLIEHGEILIKDRACETLLLI